MASQESKPGLTKPTAAKTPPQSSPSSSSPQHSVLNKNSALTSNEKESPVEGSNPLGVANKTDTSSKVDKDSNTHSKSQIAPGARRLPIGNTVAKYSPSKKPSGSPAGSPSSANNSPLTTVLSEDNTSKSVESSQISQDLNDAIASKPNKGDQQGVSPLQNLPLISLVTAPPSEESSEPLILNTPDKSNPNQSKTSNQEQKEKNAERGDNLSPLPRRSLTPTDATKEGGIVNQSIRRTIDRINAMSLRGNTRPYSGLSLRSSPTSPTDSPGTPSMNQSPLLRLSRSSATSTPSSSPPPTARMAASLPQRSDGVTPTSGGPNVPNSVTATAPSELGVILEESQGNDISIGNSGVNPSQRRTSNNINIVNNSMPGNELSDSRQSLPGLSEVSDISPSTTVLSSGGISSRTHGRGSIGSTSHFADIESGPGSANSVVKPNRSAPMRVKISSRFDSNISINPNPNTSTEYDLTIDESTDNDQDPHQLDFDSTDSAADDGQGMKDRTGSGSVLLPAYHPPIVPIPKLGFYHQSRYHESQDSNNYGGGDMLSPLSETYTGIQYPIEPSNELPMQQKKVIAISSPMQSSNQVADLRSDAQNKHRVHRLHRAGNQQNTKLMTSSAAIPGTNAVSNTTSQQHQKIDRSEWISKVLKKNPDLSNIRDRIQPLARAVSFCEHFNKGRGKAPITHELILQLVMQYLDHEGQRGALKILERESGSAYQLGNFDEFQLQDARLISLIMIALHDTESIWDIAMGERSSSRLFEKEKNSNAGSLSTSKDIRSSPSTPKLHPSNSAVVPLSLSLSNPKVPSDAVSLSPSSPHESNLTTSVSSNLQATPSRDNPEKISQQMEKLEEILAALRLRQKDQYFGYNQATSEDGDVNIWINDAVDDYYVEESTGLVVAASLNRLVEVLTPEEDVDHHFFRAFIVTHQLFCSSSLLLQKLAQRYNVPKDPSWTDEVYRKLILPVQIRVINVIKMWIEEFYRDFDDAIISNIRDFCNFQVREFHPAMATNLISLLDRLSTPYGDHARRNKTIEFVFDEEPPRPIVPKNIFHPDLRWEDVDDLEIARQLTLIDFECFYQIRTAEFLHQSWSKPHLKHRCPHLLNLIQRFNSLSEWAGFQIVGAASLKSRSKIMAKLIGIADQLKNLLNFNSLMALVAVFTSSPIMRLHHTFSEMSPKTLEVLGDLKKLMNPTNSFAAYRAVLDACLPPCVPYIGLFLTELAYIEDSAPMIVGNGLINFEKCRRIHHTINHINSLQQKGYNLQPVYQIQTLLRDFSGTKLSDKELFQRSLLIEPRGANKADIKQ